MSLCEHEVFVQEFSHKGVGRYSDVLRGRAPEPILSCFLFWGGEVVHYNMSVFPNHLFFFEVHLMI